MILKVSWRIQRAAAYYKLTVRQSQQLQYKVNDTRDSAASLAILQQTKKHWTQCHRDNCRSHLDAVIDCRGAAAAVQLSVCRDMLQCVVKMLVNLICVLIRFKVRQLFTYLCNHLIQYLHCYLHTTTIIWFNIYTVTGIYIQPHYHNYEMTTKYPLTIVLLDRTVNKNLTNEFIALTVTDVLIGQWFKH